MQVCKDGWARSGAGRAPVCKIAWARPRAGHLAKFAKLAGPGPGPSGNVCKIGGAMAWVYCKSCKTARLAGPGPGLTIVHRLRDWLGQGRGHLATVARLAWPGPGCKVCKIGWARAGVIVQRLLDWLGQGRGLAIVQRVRDLLDQGRVYLAKSARLDRPGPGPSYKRCKMGPVLACPILQTLQDAPPVAQPIWQTLQHGQPRPWSIQSC